MSELCGPVVKIKKFNCRLKNNRVTTLAFWGHVTSSVTWPFDSQWATTYGLSVVTMHLYCTVMEIWHLKSWTHGRTFRWIYLCPMQSSNAMHCIGQTIKIASTLLVLVVW